MQYADFPKHLGRQITRCLIAHQQADTIQWPTGLTVLGRIRPGTAGMLFAIAGSGEFGR
jgi:hypothetical protein